VVCAKALLNVARNCKRLQDTVLRGSFYGVTDTSMAFANSPNCSTIRSLTARTEAMIAREEAKINAALDPVARSVAPASACCLYTGGVSLCPSSPRCRTSGLEVVATGTNKIHRGGQGAHREIMAKRPR